MKSLLLRLLLCVGLLRVGLGSGWGQTNSPVQIPLRTVSPVGATFFRDKPLMPATPGSVISKDSPPASTNFLGMAGYELPPDTEGSLGTNALLSLLNTGASVQALSGSSILTNSLPR